MFRRKGKKHITSSKYEWRNSPQASEAGAFTKDGPAFFSVAAVNREKDVESPSIQDGCPLGNSEHPLQVTVLAKWGLRLLVR